MWIVRTWNKSEIQASDPESQSFLLLFLVYFVYILASLVAQRLKRLPAVWETWVLSLGWEDPLEKEMATHPSTLAWRIPWMEEPGGLQSTGLQRVRHDWATSLSVYVLSMWSVMSYSLWPQWTIDHQDPLSMIFPRQEYWSGLAFSPPKNLPNSGIKHVSPALAGEFLPLSHMGNPLHKWACIGIMHIYIHTHTHISHFKKCLIV